MALLYRGESNTQDNPKLEFYTYNNNIITDVLELRFRIFDITDQAKRQLFYATTSTETEWQTLQIFPATPGDWKVLDVENLADDPVVPGHKLGVGHYFAPWDVPEDETPGSYVIVWDYKFLGDVDYRRASTEFVVAQKNFFVAEDDIGDKVRCYMRDYAFNNELVDGFETTDAQIQKCINLTVSRYNMLAPVSVRYDVGNFPMELEYIAIMGTVGHILKSLSILQLRNQLTYTDGGVHVGLSDKHQLYKQMGMEMLAEFDQIAKEDKITRNLNAAWGFVPSPYHGYYTFYGI